MSLDAWSLAFQKKKKVMPSPSRVNESKRPSFLMVKFKGSKGQSLVHLDTKVKTLFLRKVANHGNNCRVPFPAMGTTDNPPSNPLWYTINPEWHSWVHDFVECASHVRFIAKCHDCNTNWAQAPFKSIYCCPCDRNVSHQLRSICSCIKHTHKHTKEGSSEKKSLHEVLQIWTLKKPWKIPHTALVWGKANIISSISFQCRSWNKIMGGINLNY